MTNDLRARAEAFHAAARARDADYQHWCEWYTVRNDAPSLVSDLLAEVERLRGVIDRARAVGGDPDDWDMPDESLREIRRILQEAKRHD